MIVPDNSLRALSVNVIELFLRIDRVIEPRSTDGFAKTKKTEELCFHQETLGYQGRLVQVPKFREPILLRQ